MDILPTVAATLQEHRGKELDQPARECEVVQRKREFTGQPLLLLIVVTLLHKPDASWVDFHITAAQLGLHVSRTAIENRFAAGQPLVNFLRSALEEALQKTVAGNPSSANLLQRFTAVLVGDATTIALPDELADLRKQTAGLVDREVLRGVSDRLRCRLIAIRVPEAIANRRRQEAREKAKKKGRLPTAEYLERLGGALFITNGRAGAPALEGLAIFYAKLLGVVLQNGIRVATAGANANYSMTIVALALRDRVKSRLRCLEDRLDVSRRFLHKQRTASGFLPTRPHRFSLEP